MEKDLNIKKIKNIDKPNFEAKLVELGKLDKNIKDSKLIRLVVENFEDYCHEYVKSEKLDVENVRCVLFVKQLIEDLITYENSNKISKIMKKVLPLENECITTSCWKKLLDISSNPKICCNYVNSVKAL